MREKCRSGVKRSSPAPCSRGSSGHDPCLLLGAALAAAPQGKLVVLVVVDQLRYADLLWLAPEFGHKGFAGLGRPAPMRYETAVAETAPGHAVLSTGAYADVNGIVGNSFWQGNRYQEAVEDPACPVWGTTVGR